MPSSDRIHVLRRDAHAVWLAIRDPRTPWYAKLWGWLIAAYALSPIDLIPDFVPLLGLIDDLIILPAGIWVFVKLVPGEQRSEEHTSELQSLMRISYAVFCLKKKKTQNTTQYLL